VVLGVRISVHNTVIIRYGRPAIAAGDTLQGLCQARSTEHINLTPTHTPWSLQSMLEHSRGMPMAH